MIDIWEAKQAHQYIDKLVSMIEAEKARVEAATFNFSSAKIEPLGTYKISSTYFNAEDPNAQSTLDAMYANDKETSKKNQAITESNKKVYDALVSLMKNLGFSTVKRGKLVRGRRTEETSDWAQHLYMIPTHDTFNIDAVYKQYCDRIADVLKKRKDSEAKMAAELKAEERKRAELRLLVELGVKYGQDFMSTYDAIHHILKKDKYLKLAYYLSKNRGDWTEGPSYAEIGMEGFEVITEDDALIDKEISDLISDWCGDGRCFRDCEWNYDKLYGMADENLKRDLVSLMEYECY